MPDMPKKFFDWPEEAHDLAPEKVIELYHNGMAGALRDPEADAALAESMQWKNFGDAASAFGLEESGAGKLSTPYMSVLKFAPAAFPGPAQTTGDCVSRGTANACTILLGVEADLGLPDPDTGIVEGFPEVPNPAQGIVASEPIYGYRGHSGQGANCSRLADFVKTAGGILLRKPYPDLGVDFTNYNSKTGAAWGGRGTPDKVCEEGKKHQVRAVTRITSIEQARDAIANGYGLNCCSGYGFSDTRDENGVSKRKGGWSHAMAWIGVDDTDWAHQTYGGMLFLVQNSWARWNSGPKKHNQPDGSFWIIARDAAGMINSGGTYAFSNVNGFPGRELPNYFVL